MTTPSSSGLTRKKKAYQAMTAPAAIADEEQQRPGNAAAVHDLLNLVLAALQHFLEVGGLSAAAAGTLAPRAAAALPPPLFHPPPPL